MFDIIFEYKYLLVSCAALYLAFVRYHRYKYINSLRKKYPDPTIVLQDLKLAQEIFSNVLLKEFPFTTRQSLEVALFRTYTVPKTSKLLCATAEFKNDCPRRVEDTEFILREFIEPYSRIQRQLEKNPNTPQEDIEFQFKRSDLAISRLNEIHGRYKISNDDFIHTLALFISEPREWINRYEWREMDIRERYAFFHVFYDMGTKMKIKNIPKTIDEMKQFHEDYSEKHARYAPENWKIAEPTLRHLLSALPRFLQEPAYQASIRTLPSLIGPLDSEAFHLPKEKKWVTFLILHIFRTRAFFIRHFCLPRTQWITRTPFYPNEKGYYVPEFNVISPVYQDGYKIEELGPEKLLPKTCPVAH